MKNLIPNMTCAETKLNLIEGILQMDCSDINNLSSLSPEMHYELTDQQLICMHDGAKDVLSKTHLNDFKINARSFKSVDLTFGYVHYMFIDKVSLSRFPEDINGDTILVNTIAQDYDLYYIIVNCDDPDLFSFEENNYHAYLVDDNFMAREIKFASNFNLIRDEFVLSDVAELIRKRSTLNGITEYVTFPLEIVQTFLNDQDNQNDFVIKLVRINKSCLLGGMNPGVSNALKEPRRQKKLSMAFQKNNDKFYDIGNMQP